MPFYATEYTHTHIHTEFEAYAHENVCGKVLYSAYVCFLDKYYLCIFPDETSSRDAA